METVHPNGTVIRISDGYATIAYRDGGVSVVASVKMPKGTVVGSKVTVVIETVVKEVKLES